MLDVKICMGSACFIKGNQENLKFIQEYIAQNNLEAKVSITGSLCDNKCEDGPRIIINDKEYTNVSKDDILELLKGI